MGVETAREALIPFDSVNNSLFYNSPEPRGRGRLFWVRAKGGLVTDKRHESR
jgi:hypothetical protein